MLKNLIFLTAFSGIYLNRFGLPIANEFSLSFSYIFMYAGLMAAYVQRRIYLDIAACFCLLAFFFTGTLSFLYGEDSKSLNSFLLACFIYFPLVFKPTRGSKAQPSEMALLYLRLLIPLAFFGVAQFVIQFIYKPDWLFDFRPYLPVFLQNKNQMNTVIPFSSFLKSNGFFLLEPSIFSQWMALAITFFVISPCGTLYLILFYIGLLLSFSGTGLITLACLMVFGVFSLNTRAFRLTQLFSFFLVLLLLFGPARVTLSRFEEFKGTQQMQTTSAAARFVFPFYVTHSSLQSSPKSFFLGNGPGTILRSKEDFDYHDPTYSKLLFEYGVLGFFSFLTFLFFSFNVLSTNISNIIINNIYYLYYYYVYINIYIF